MTALHALTTINNANRVAEVIERQQEHRFVSERLSRNVHVPGCPQAVTRENLWHAHMLGLLTSQQPSGEGDPVWLLLNERPFPLSYAACSRAGDVFGSVRKVLVQHGGIRFCEERIPGMAEHNFSVLEAGAWQTLKQHGRALLRRRRRSATWMTYEADLDCETRAAAYLDRELRGFGPKQSRNFWQALGLTRYVCVLDSRVRKWCEGNLEGDWCRFDLSVRSHYFDMADSLHQLCRLADVLPCVFDAAVFSTFEGELGRTSWCRW